MRCASLPPACPLLLLGLPGQACETALPASVGAVDSYALGDFSVSRIGFGAMQLPGPGVWGPPRDRGEALTVLRRAVELGVDHIDTAQYYGPDVANELIREALHPYPGNLAPWAWRPTSC